MEVNITQKGIEVLPEHLEQEIKKKIQKLEKYFNNVQKASVILTKQRGQFVVETTIFVAGRIIRAVGKGNMIDKAVNENFDKLKIQMQKYNDHFKNPKRIPKTAGVIIPEEPQESEPRIVKTKTFSVKPMSVEEAILQLELLGHDFFIFRDIETNLFNVVYKRKDGNYGLIIPQE